MTNKDLIEQVRELNEKRTQGDWCVEPLSGKYYGTEVTIGDYGVTVWQGYSGYPSAREVEDGWEPCDGMDHVENEESFATAQFIALAPQMAQALLEKDRQLQIAREAFVDLAETATPSQWHVIEKTLSEMEDE